MNGFNRLIFLLLLLLVFLLARPAFGAGIDVKTYINIYYLSEHKLGEFDRELGAAYPLAAPGFLERSKTYRELIALRVLKEKEALALRAGYQSLSGAGLDTFLNELHTLDPAERLALSDLLSSLPALGGRSLPVFYSSLSQELEARRAALSFVSAHIQRALKNKTLLERMRQGAEKLDFSSPRGELPERIRPGVGSEGTVNGRQFPERTWALTFDDGPHTTRSKEIFEALKYHSKKATFFWVVKELEKVPGIPIEGVHQGHSMNNHSWTHVNLDKATADTNRKEIIESTERNAEYYGNVPRFFRLPFGAGLNNKAVRQMIADQGMIHVFWNVDTLDWQEKDPAKILNRTKKQMATEKRGVILFHDIHAQSVEATKLLLKHSAALEGTPQELRWVTLPEIVEQLNKREQAAVFPLDPKPVLR